MDPVWTESGRRTLLAHEFVLAVQAELEAHRGAQKNSKALERAIAKVRERKPTYEKWPEPTLRRQYYEGVPRPVPLSVEKDRCTSLLQKWGVPAEEARGLVTRALAVADAAQNPSYVKQLLDWIDSRRAWDRHRKANYVRPAVDDMEANRFPLMRGARREPAR
jgi:hypothetical protein